MIMLAVRALYRYMISFACVCVFTMQCIACHEFYISKKLSSVPPGTSCPLKKANAHCREDNDTVRMLAVYRL